MHRENLSACEKNAAGEARSPLAAVGPVLVSAGVEPTFATVAPGDEPPQPAASAAAAAAAIAVVKARGSISFSFGSWSCGANDYALGGYTAVTRTVTSV
jgi:hypothetical protein